MTRHYTVMDGMSDWFGLGPVSVLPAWQGERFGTGGGVPPEHFMALAWGQELPQGEVACHPAFAARA